MDKGTLTRATRIPTQRMKIITIVEATTVDTVDTVEAVEDKDIQSRATKTLAPSKMTTVEEAATGKMTPMRATKIILTRSTKMMTTADRTPRPVQVHGNAAGHVERDIRM